MAAYGTIADPANPNDPAQLRNWAMGMANNAANISLFDPTALSQMQGTLNPYFKQQQSSYANRYGGLLNSQIAGAQQSAGAAAALNGINPASYVQKAGGAVRSQMSPSYMSGYSDLINNQNQSLLGATSQSQQAKQNAAMQAAQMMMLGSQQAAQTWDQPGFWDYLGGGLLGAAGSLLGPLGTAGGAWLGNQIFGSGNNKW